MPDPLQQGDQAVIMTGPFEGKVGAIAAIDGDMATLTLDVFARETRVQVDLADLAGFRRSAGPPEAGSLAAT